MSSYSGHRHGSNAGDSNNFLLYTEEGKTDMLSSMHLTCYTPMGTTRYLQVWERCPCKEALHENTESNWTDACSESYNNWYFLFVMTWRNIDILPGLVSRPIKFL